MCSFQHIDIHWSSLSKESIILIKIWELKFENPSSWKFGDHSSWSCIILFIFTLFGLFWTYYWFCKWNRPQRDWIIVKFYFLSMGGGSSAQFLLKYLFFNLEQEYIKIIILLWFLSTFIYFFQVEFKLKHSFFSQIQPFWCFFLPNNGAVWSGEREFSWFRLW